VSVVAYWVVALVTLAGAAVVLSARETMRLVIGLGAFLLGMAGLYLYHGMALLAASQVFLYVGGVLVLFIFAIMALRRDPDGRGRLVARLDLGAASVCGGLFVVLVAVLSDLAPLAGPVTVSSLDGVGEFLLGAYLPQFEIVGVLLLVALVAALAITGRGDER
jgi:NADH:ubiquinone oxidoreductase subunit 6 (subunit J)